MCLDAKPRAAQVAIGYQDWDVEVISTGSGSDRVATLCPNRDRADETRSLLLPVLTVNSIDSFDDPLDLFHVS